MAQGSIAIPREKIWDFLQCADVTCAIEELAPFVHSDRKPPLEFQEECKFVLFCVYLRLDALPAAMAIATSFKRMRNWVVATILQHSMIRRTSGVKLSAERMQMLRKAFALLDRKYAGFGELLAHVADAEVECGNPEFIVNLHPDHYQYLDIPVIVDAFLAAGKAGALQKHIEFRFAECDHGTFCQKCWHLKAYTLMRMRNPVAALPILEAIVVDAVRTQMTVVLGPYRLLIKCYEMLARDTYVLGPLTERYRMCGHCAVFIDRAPLLEAKTDFLVCGQCRNVPYCSAECSEKHWDVHEAQCGTSHLPKRLIDPFASSACSFCARVGASQHCTRCKRARYCDAKCQKAHWKMHKTDCVESE